MSKTLTQIILHNTKLHTEQTVIAKRKHHKVLHNSKRTGNDHKTVTSVKPITS